MIPSILVLGEGFYLSISGPVQAPDTHVVHTYIHAKGLDTYIKLAVVLNTGQPGIHKSCLKKKKIEKLECTRECNSMIALSPSTNKGSEFSLLISDTKPVCGG